MKGNAVVHFEMPAEDRKRMVDFYSGVFGWQCQQLGPEMGEFVLVTTTESDNNNVPMKTGAPSTEAFIRRQMTYPRLRL